jgi:toxin ParE1/3/4
MRNKWRPTSVAIEVRFRPSARADLFNLYSYIAKRSGRDRAGKYIDRIEAACLRLGSFPQRGTRQEELGPGLRTIGFERRVTILFRVTPDMVEIVRVLCGGRDLKEALRAL